MGSDLPPRTRHLPPGPQLAVHAAHEHNSRGRRHPEAPPNYRSEFQRDRDRIIHSTGFRRLEYKTQVFVNHEGDLFRTRLTHSLEVAQIARSVARVMGLNEDLTEAIALAHDLGHTPFGHAGQDALNDCMRDYGGFEHNIQSLRVVDELETRYAEFPGLNLTFETREGILKHCSQKNARQLGDVGERFLIDHQPSLEAQLNNLADEIAYNNHDVDDGVRAGLIGIEQLRGVKLFAEHYEPVMRRHPNLSERQIVHEVIRRMINHLVVDLIETSRNRIAAAAPADIEGVRRQPEPLMSFSPQVQADNLELKRFLRQHLYRHYRVHRMSVKARRLIGSLFHAYMDDIGLLPHEYQEIVRQREAEGGVERRARVVADYIAGMTDRYAIGEHARLFDPATLS
ncbi:MAG: deoxyguanosinetriphosphate triphosphohydrolase [Chromatiales bacterium]|jgi:dGTPase|nr:deoxyguanosinetriphosphate triphosphohydrolase [Chromatiales bacterium]MDX9767408.1 deoxyguanosinetriphosphate triphosphohydrolase [Ectothiorhodospiraceae bacterium]